MNEDSDSNDKPSDDKPSDWYGFAYVLGSYGANGLLLKLWLAEVMNAIDPRGIEFVVGVMFLLSPLVLPVECFVLLL